MSDLLVGPQNVVDGAGITGRGGNQGEAITGLMTGQYYEQTMRGRTFLYSVASQALLLSATTGGHPTVFNPAGSGVIFVPVSLCIGFISGTTVIGSANIATTTGAGAGAATGAAILTATAVAAKTAFRGCPTVFASGVIWSPTTNTFTAAPTVEYSTGIELGAVAPSAGSGVYSHDFNGRLAYYPGTAMSVVNSVTTSTALFSITIVGIEVPLPVGR